MRKIKSLFWAGIILLLTQSCEQENPKQIGENYFLGYDSEGRTIITDASRGWIIDPQIVAWNFDSTYIIAKQKPYHSICDSLRIKYPNTSLNFREKIYNESNIYNYWIIDKQKELNSYYDGKARRYTSGLYGPFTYEEYWEKRKEFNVPDSLKLLEAEKVSFPGPVHSLFYKWFYSPPARERVVE